MTRKKEKACFFFLLFFIFFFFGKGVLIDIAVPSESNTSTKFTEKLSKYQDSEIEVNRIWGTKKNNYAVEPILTANSPLRPPFYNAFFFGR